MVFPLPRPAVLLDLTRSAVAQAAGAAITLAGLPGRTLSMIDNAETLVRRIGTVMDRIETTLDQTERIVGSVEATIDQIRTVTASTAAPIATAIRVSEAAEQVVAEAQLVAGKASAAMAQAERTATTAEELLSAYAKTLRKGAPMAQRFIDQLSPEEIDAAVRLVDELPALNRHLTSDVMPILATLDRVGPDIHDLLNVTRDLKLAIAGIPGLSMLRRRGEGRLPETDSAGS